jgi:hypothetical protein
LVDWYRHGIFSISIVNKIENLHELIVAIGALHNFSIDERLYKYNNNRTLFNPRNEDHTEMRVVAAHFQS